MAKELQCVVDGSEASIEVETEEEMLGQAEDRAGEAHPDLEGP